MSAPCSRGCWNSGPRKVLSTASGTGRSAVEWRGGGGGGRGGGRGGRGRGAGEREGEQGGADGRHARVEEGAVLGPVPQGQPVFGDLQVGVVEAGGDGAPHLPRARPPRRRG